MNVISVLILFIAILSKSWTAHLPSIKEVYHSNQLQLHDFHSVTQDQLIPHQSYDKNDDVVDLQITTDDHDDDDRSAKHRERRQISDWLIAPNTRWCGRGNLANGTYNHLGGASSADKCCRKHDHCQLYIPAMSNRFELFNYRPYTLSHCNCDRRFRTCLKMANDEDAKTIGKLFFNMVTSQCFILKTERICQQRSDDDSCEREIVRQKAYLRNNKKF